MWWAACHSRHTLGLGLGRLVPSAQESCSLSIVFARGSGTQGSTGKGLLRCHALLRPWGNLQIEKQ